MASYVSHTSPRKNNTKDIYGLSKTMHTVSATAVAVASPVPTRNSYQLPSSTQARPSASGGSYVTKADVQARRNSKNQYGISASMHASSSSYSSIDYNPYEKYKNPAASAEANQPNQVWPSPSQRVSSSSTRTSTRSSTSSSVASGGYSAYQNSAYQNIPTSVGSSRTLNRRGSFEESVPEGAEAYPCAPNLDDSMPHVHSNRSMSQKTSATFEGGPTNGLVSEGDPVQCDKIDYEIKGFGMQMVEIELDPDEACIAEAGAMMFIEDYIYFDAKLGDGSEPKKGFFKKLVGAGGRMFSGESFFTTHFTNKGNEKARVAFGAPYPGTIIPINLAEMPGEKITCQRDAFLCAAMGTRLSVSFNKRIGSGFFGGEGFVLQKLEGDGMAFIHAGGHVVRRELDRERIRLDTGCLVAYSSGIDFEVEHVKGMKSMFFGGEGCFLAILKGTGSVWMQSLPFSRMADRIVRSAPSFGGPEFG